MYTAEPRRYDSTDYVRAGRSGLLLPPIALGLWNSFGSTDRDRSPDAQGALLRRAFDAGMTHFDLANNYGPPPGAAEESFGRVFASDLRPYRDELVISTKAGYRMGVGPYQDGGSRKYLLSSLDASLARLKLDHVDIFYHHCPDPATPIEETMGALASAVRSGKALYVGVSNYSAAQLRDAERALRAEGVHLSLSQPRYNMFDRQLELDGSLPALEELGIGAVAYSPLAGGLLTDRYLDGIPSGSRAVHAEWMQRARTSAVYQERVRALQEIASGRGQTLGQLAITWVLRHAPVTTALIGASSIEQFDANWVARSAVPLSSEEIGAIEMHAVHGTERV